MSNAIPIQNKETFNVQNHFWIKKILRFCWTFWPILVAYSVIPKLFWLLNYFFNKNIALYFFYLSNLIILGATVLFHRFKWGKSFTVLLAVCLCIKDILLAIQYLIKKFIYYPEFWSGILYIHSLYILIKILLIFSSLKGIRYLWSHCNYCELFALHKIKFVENLSDSWGSRFTIKFGSIIREINRNVSLGIFKEIWKYRKWILSLWFVPVMYTFWFKRYFFLYPNSSLIQFFNYLKIMSIPLGVIFIALFLYKPCKLINRTGVILAAIFHIGAEAYGLAQYVTYYYHHAPISWNSKNLTKVFMQVRNFLNNPNSWIFILDFLYLSIGVYILIKLCFSLPNFGKKSKLLKRSTNYGSAKFLDLKGIKKINNKEGIPIGAVSKISDFRDVHGVIESIKKRGGDELIRIKASHTTLVAPSRTGKGTGIIVPTLLEYPGPVFVTDVKGENYPITRRMRESKGRKVIAFDPFGITEAPRIKIDPLKILNSHSMEVVEDAQTLSKLLCPDYEQDGTNAHHFRSQAAALIQCLLLYVSCSTKLLRSQRSLAYVYDLLCLPLEEQTHLMLEIGSDNTLAYGTPARIANSIASTHHEERSGIFSTARVEMRFIDTPQIREAITIDSSEAKGDKGCKNLNQEEIEGNKIQPEMAKETIPSILLSDITKGDMDLFVCIPLEKLSTQHRLLRLITGIVFIEMQKARGKIGKYNLLMVLDEMPALGHMKQIEEMLVYGGGFGISLLTVSQTIEFLQSVYRNTWKTFFSNQLSIFFACSEPMTSKFVAEKLGKKTIEVASINQSTGAQKRSMELLGTSSNQLSNSASETGRELLMPEEIERLGDRVVLAFDRGEDPIICHRIDYRERPEWIGLWDENPLHANRVLHSQFSLKEYGKEVIRILAS